MRKIPMPPRQPGRKRESVDEWFPRWLPIHKRLNPHNGFETYETCVSAGVDIYDGWIRAFKLRGISGRAALAISQEMQSMPKPEGGLWPEHHLPVILRLHQAIQAGAVAVGQLVSRERRERERVEFEAREAEVLARWQKLPEGERKRRKAAASARYPGLDHLPRWVEACAITDWIDE